ncbi:gliding motility-associated C-terminal domain-containing protein [Flavobacterium sp.]|uniref:T9SS type B sorting domain-containing protein n=1 Tax=Flavobacterium sp. TaxID=239 RepID=UPI003750BFDB
MKSKITTLINKYIFVFVLVAFFSSTKTFGQIGTPTYAFTQICASPSFNSYTANFTFTTANTYVLEMSDSSGSFTTLTSISILSSQTTTSPGSFTFSVPTITGGQNYRLRVRSSASTGSSSPAFPAYYQSFNNSFYINNKISTANICGGGSFTLSIDNPTVADPSPVSFPSLKYKWYNGATLIADQIGTSIDIITSGVYHVEIDYGSCTTSSSITKSQNVMVNIVPVGATFTIASSGGNTICSSSPTTLSVTAGYGYQWFRDGVSIPGATAYNYLTSQAGSYKVVVDQGGCSSTSASFVLSNISFNSSIDVQEEPLVNIIAAGETKTITVTTDAANPTFEWYKIGDPTILATTNSYSTSDVGHYKVQINQTTGCNTLKQHLFELREGINPKEVPNLISPNGDNKNDTWILPQDYINANTEVLIISPQGNVDFQTTNYDNKWPYKEIVFKSTNPVYYYVISKDGSPVKKGSITIIK